MNKKVLIIVIAALVVIAGTIFFVQGGTFFKGALLQGPAKETTTPKIAYPTIKVTTVNANGTPIVPLMDVIVYTYTPNEMSYVSKKVSADGSIVFNNLPTLGGVKFRFKSPGMQPKLSYVDVSGNVYYAYDETKKAFNKYSAEGSLLSSYITEVKLAPAYSITQTTKGK